MAELTRPTFQRTRLKTKPAKSSSAPMPSIPNAQKGVSHKVRMAQIASKGIVNIIDAYEAAEATAVRLELAEEDVRLQKHIGIQKMKVTGNLITALPNQLLPKDMEDNFMTDGHKIGEDTITPFVVSPELSDKAKELIAPTIDAANNGFNIDTQSVFTKELVDRSKIAIKNRRNKELNSFQNYMTHITREGVEKPTGLYEPNKNQIAEYTAKQYEAFLQTEIKYKNLNDVQAKLMLHEFKEELAGTILSRHMAQNPTEALEQYTKRPYMVGGVPVDSARVAKNIDSLIRSKENKRIADESDAYEIRMMSYARNNSREALDKYSDDINKENHRIMKSRIASGDFEDYDEAIISEENTRQYVPNYLMLNDNDPYLTKKVLEKIVATAVIGEKALEKERKRKLGGLFLAQMKHGLLSPTIQYSQHYKETNYEWVEGRGWLPKPEAIDKTARTYGLDPTEVKTAYINAIATLKTNVRPGGGIGFTDFKIFQNDVLQYHNDIIFEDYGLRDEERKLKRDGTLEEPYVMNPLDLPEGKALYSQMNKVEQGAMNAMVVDLMDLKVDYRNTNNMSLPDMIARYDRWEKRFKNKDGSQEIQGKVWNNIKNVRWHLRLKDLQERPIGTVGNDLKLLDKMLQYPDVELDTDEKKSVIKRLKFLKIWKRGQKVTKQLYIPSAYWEVQKEKHGTQDSRQYKLTEALKQAKLNP